MKGMDATDMPLTHPIQRRDFLASGGAGLAACLLPAGANSAASAKRYSALQEARQYRKVDAHGHAGDLGVTAGLVLECCDRLGIERSTISLPLPDGDRPEEFREANRRTLAAVREFPRRLIGQCVVNPRYPKEALEELNRCLGDGFAGLGELYHQVKINDPLYYPLIEKCIQEKASIVMHSRADTGLLRPGIRTSAPPATSTPRDFADVARRYPEAILIYAHIGGGGDWEYACKILRAVPSVFADTSGSITDEAMVDFAVKSLGVDRLLFATDTNYESGVGKILAAKLTETERRKVFWDNFNNILRRRGLHAD
jgi:predicted TIM-barrel fold metal-dependent hydrolase